MFLLFIHNNDYNPFFKAQMHLHYGEQEVLRLFVSLWSMTNPRFVV